MNKAKIVIMQSIILQIPHTHPIWSNVFFYLLIVAVLGFIIYSLYMIRLMKKRTADMKLMQQQHVARVDVIRKDHAETLEKIRVEMLNREEERGRQWMESEKETLHVLNGVSMLLDLNDKIGRSESEKIIKLLADVQETVEGFKSTEILKVLDEIQKKINEKT